jgi:RimJ/RimL family protein N-acetyltransferase
VIRHGNARSIKVAEKLGSKLAGETELLGGKALLYEVLRPARGP